ncbi:disease resistance protein RPV1 [Eucalyptus grandis]|uniref:disease resistance protein RPV1 n=1 Tax=Eucalyptus grandis TaxID=71139 RepID=UPI00192EFE9B|nr:disease resistance protein RPV1 [Eucalyptus grandis]
MIDAGIQAYRDDEELRTGEEIGGQLLQAIQHSKISIPIFSKGYADSPWCLRELVKMVESKNTGGQKIMPIFYNVTPSEVKYQNEHYNNAIVSDLNKKQFDDETINKWKATLKEQRSLIKIRDDNQLWMHDWLRDIGRSFIEEGSGMKPENQPWVWTHEQALDILEKMQDCKSLQKLPNEIGALESLMELLLDSTSIKEIHKWRRMKNLKILSMAKCRSLNKFSFFGCSTSVAKLLLVDNHFNSLIELDLSNTSIRELPNSIGYMKKLKVLKLCHCPIRKLPSDIGMLEKLEQLEAGAELTEILSDIGKLPILRKLVFAGGEISTMPQLPESLVTLTIDLYSMKRMPDISNLLNLRNLKLNLRLHPSKLAVDPSSWGIGRLRMLEVLDLYCLDIGTLSFDLVLLSKLKELHIQCHNLQCLPRLPTNLSYLCISNCYKLKATNDFSNMKALSLLDISWFKALTEIEGLEGLENLRTLVLRGLSLAKLPDLTSLKKLKAIHVHFCFELVKVLDCPKSLETLEIEYCPKVQKWPDPSRLKNLKVPFQGKRE